MEIDVRVLNPEEKRPTYFFLLRGQKGNRKEYFCSCCENAREFLEAHYVKLLADGFSKEEVVDVCVKYNVVK